MCGSRDSPSFPLPLFSRFSAMEPPSSTRVSIQEVLLWKIEAADFTEGRGWGLTTSPTGRHPPWIGSARAEYGKLFLLKSRGISLSPFDSDLVNTTSISIGNHLKRMKPLTTRVISSSNQSMS